MTNNKNAVQVAGAGTASQTTFDSHKGQEQRLLAVLLVYGQTSTHDLDGFLGAENFHGVAFRLKNIACALPFERRKLINQHRVVTLVGSNFLPVSSRSKASSAVFRHMVEGA